MIGRLVKTKFWFCCFLVCRLIGTSASWEHRNISEDFKLSQTVLQSPDGVFEYVNVSLDFRHAERYCRQQFSLLPNDTSQDDLESTKNLLLALGVSDPVWLRNSSAHGWGNPWATGGQNSHHLLSILMFQEITHTKYAKVNLQFPVLSEITVCAMVQWDNKTQGVSTIFSYAEPFFINAFQLRGQTDEHGNINMALIVHGHHTPYKMLLRNDGEWHHLCVTWQKAKGTWAIYIDRKKGNSGSGLYASNDINGDGMFIIGQDQDTLGGTFNEAFCGNITALNIWNKTLSEEQVAGVSPCSMITQNLLFHWDLTKITVEATVERSLMKLMCPDLKSLPNKECRSFQITPGTQQQTHGYSPCTRPLAFVCKHKKGTYLKLKEIQEAHEENNTQFIDYLIKLTNSSTIEESMSAQYLVNLSVSEVHKILQYTHQALREGDGELEPSDLLALVQFLMHVADMDVKASESTVNIGELSRNFIAIAGAMFAKDHVSKWAAIRELVNGPMTVVQSIDRMAANLNLLLTAGSSEMVIDSSNIKLKVKQRVLSHDSSGADFYGLQSGNESTGDYISVPPEQIKELHRNGFKKLTFVNTWYGSLHPYFESENNIIEFSAVSDGSRKYVGTVLGSSVISTTILSDAQQINMAVHYQLQHRVEYTPGLEFEPVCVFWDFNLRMEKGGSWSTTGCTVTALGYKSTSCFCNHTTNFALLLQVYEVQRSPAEESTLRMLTFIGCGVSLCALALTFILFIAVGVPNSDRTTVHKNLIFALATAETLILFSELASSNKVLCMAVTALLHLFFMASFTWMLVEGLLLWSKVVSVNISEDRRMKLYYVIGWGLPVIIVGITLATSFNKYMADNHCWLNVQTEIIWAFVGPVLLVLSVNAFVLFRVVMVTVASARRRSKMLTPSSTPQLKALDLTWATIKPVLVLLPLLGLTWLCGVLVHFSVVLAYIFIAMNAFQGLYIFLVYAVYNSEVRSAIKRMKEKKKALSFTNCSQPISFLTTQKTTDSWDHGKCSISTPESSVSSPKQCGSTKKSLVLKNEGFRKESVATASLNQAVQLTSFKPSGC
ncbi:adhesion G-protein coupled receptor D2-like [Polyodon spathula]|uniref:adhesion G-protein coupled receptor D2-like n=1 Tax=Polyodon spathula TaxID=7913 RepID=UPI001B7E1FB3|nr:adhesion G-protein coupled receptor D2-like [Polyodon spathula]